MHDSVSNGFEGHRLRKAGATIAAENGATARQLMAIFGWYSIDQAEFYTRAADQKRLASSAMHLLESHGGEGASDESGNAVT